jgi:DNA excision repair protein ERCC-2
MAQPLKTVSIGVTDFALPAPRRGSIDAFSGFARGQETGIELHQRIQAERARANKDYKAEVGIKARFERGGYAFEIAGKIDGLTMPGTDENSGAAAESNLCSVPAKIEEIKSSFSIYELARRLREQQDDHPYCLQVKTYGYFHFLKTGTMPELKILLVSTRNGETMDFDLKLHLPTFEAWLERRLAELVEDAKLSEKRAKRRVKAGASLAFPFANPRSGQIELIETIEEGMREKRPMLIQAPTGLGKTVGVLYPTLKEALARGQRVVYITPKNSQHAVAEDAVERLQEAGGNIRSMTLTAKSKMCMKNEPLCNPEYCEFARDHYTKVAEHRIVEQLSKKRKLTAKTFKKIAEEHEVCPFEIQLDAAQDADAVICDYNYVFAPRSALGRLASAGLDQQGKPNLVIDEAHNLPSRATDYYSPSLSTFTLEKMREDLARLPKKFRADALTLLASCIAVVKKCGPTKATKPQKIEPPAGAFLEQDAELRNFLSTYLKSDVEIQPRDPVLKLCFYWAEFTGALEFVNCGREEFFVTFHPEPATVKITCCDASEMLKGSYLEYDQVVAFSATLKPFDFYSRLAGLQSKQLKTAEFVSPFPKTQRKLLIIPQISSKFSERERNYPRIAETIKKIAELKRGNYFAFFPSFDFMERVAAQFTAPDGFEIMKQQRRMAKGDIDLVLETLKDTRFAHIMFAVQGGVFSEGVDYPGEMIIGAFVVGPPLPSFDLEREKMREYYQANYSAGFDYAYVYPAMAKAVQAAGRVIRSETDRGLIVLMDNRFIQPSFAKSMPGDWFEKTPRELVSGKILSDVSDFWKATVDPSL